MEWRKLSSSECKNMQVNGIDSLISTYNVGGRYCFGLECVSYVMCDVGRAESVSVSSRMLASE